MKRFEVTILDSNCAAFPAGSRAWAQEQGNELTELAEHFIEVVSYVHTANRVEVRTALGYQFAISIADYHRLMLE